jgi:hypothetical protein
VTGQTAKLDDLQAQRLQLDHQFVDGFLIRQRAVHDCLDRLDRDSHSLERQQLSVTHATLDPDLVVDGFHASPLLVPAGCLQVATMIRPNAESLITPGGWISPAERVTYLPSCSAITLCR